MTIYESILNNQDYLKIMKKIDKIKFITDGKWDWEHGLGHSMRVANHVKKILIQLNADERTIDLGMAAALLHDIGLVKGKKTDHAIESSKKFYIFVNAMDITEKEKNIMEQAIADHSRGDNISSLVGLALILADKLDITYHRTIDSSIQDEMNKSLQKIRDVSVEINKDALIINYETVNDLDIRIILDGWSKSILIPRKVANYLNKKFIFMINNSKIDL